MENKPLVSIIVACYNAERYIDACIISLLNQTYKNIEIVICDDASKDNSYEILLGWAKKYSNIIVLHNENNLFAAAARNRCFEVARGDYYMIQDIDDLSKPDRIKVLLHELQFERIDFVSSAVDTFVDDANVISGHIVARKKYPKRFDFLWNVPFVHPSTMFTKECIKAVNGYRVSKETKRGQDYDMFMRLYAKGFRGKNISKSLYLFRVDNENIKRRTFEARVGEYKIRRRGFKMLGLMPWAIPFVFKPFVAHFFQKIKYMGN